MQLDDINILGVRIAGVNLSRARLFIEDCIKQQKKTYVCVAPVATIVDCRQDKEYLKIVNEAGMVTPDGMPLVWLAKMKGHSQVERTYGPDLMLELCRQQGLRHFFYGASTTVLEQLQTRLKACYPTINIAGYHAPEFSREVAVASPEVIDKINASQPDIIWVALGSPKQDFWMHRHRPFLQAPVLIGVGAAFDFLAGTKPQAPRWMQYAGLEWLFRLLCEPRRLWKRYLIGNTKFLYYLCCSAFKKDSVCKVD